VSFPNDRQRDRTESEIVSISMREEGMFEHETRNDSTSGAVVVAGAFKDNINSR
jgi:hypothetical protein